MTQRVLETHKLWHCVGLYGLVQTIHTYHRMSVVPPSFLPLSLYVIRTPTVILSGLQVQKRGGRDEQISVQYDFDAISHRYYPISESTRKEKESLCFSVKQQLRKRNYGQFHF